MNPRVYTFYAHVPELEHNGYPAMLEYWKQAWARLGWEPTVIGIAEAREHPLYESVRAHIAKLPTVNPRAYVLWDFLRWLAMGVVGGGLHTDTDVIPYASYVNPEFFDYGDEDSFWIFTPNRQPCMCWVGNADTSMRLAKAFLTYGTRDEDVFWENGQPHCDDQAFFQVRQMGQPHPICVTYQYPGWRTAACVHYSNAAMAKRWPGAVKGDFPRHIEQLRPLNS